MQKKSLIASLLGVLFAGFLGHSSDAAPMAEGALLERGERVQQISSVEDKSPLMFSKATSEKMGTVQTHYSHSSHSSHSSHYSHSSHRSSY
jgi:hypothetical protein